MLEERWHQYQEQHGQTLAAADKNTDTAAGSNKMQACDSVIVLHQLCNEQQNTVCGGL